MIDGTDNWSIWLPIQYEKSYIRELNEIEVTMQVTTKSKLSVDLTAELSWELT